MSRDTTDVRFGMRSLLLTMAGVAFVAAMLGHQIRGFRDDIRWHVALVWAACSLVVVALVAWHARRRFRLERRAGRMLVALAPYGPFGLRLRSWPDAICGLLLIFVGVAQMEVAASALEGQRNVRIAYLQTAFPCFCGAALIAGGIALIWWNRSMQLRQHGVMRGLRLTLWEHVTDCHWRNDVLVVQGVDVRQNDVELAACVSMDELEQVVSIMTQKLSAVYSPPLKAGSENCPVTTMPELSSDHREIVPPTRHPRIERSPLFPIHPNGGQAMRRMRMAFAAYMFGAAFVLVRPWVRQSTAFNVGAMIGCATMGLSFFREWGRSLPTGAPLIRLKPRLDWLSWCAALLVALGCCWLNRQYGPVVPLRDGLLGSVCGVSSFALVGMMLREKFDLYENGVMHFPSRVLPWKTLRVLKWNRNGPGSLVLRSGIWRIRAKVPTELRDAVNSVLHERLGILDEKVPGSEYG